MALLTEDRRLSGVFPMLTVRLNMAIANIGSYLNRLGLLDNKGARRMRRFRPESSNQNPKPAAESGKPQRRQSAESSRSPLADDQTGNPLPDEPHPGI